MNIKRILSTYYAFCSVICFKQLLLLSVEYNYATQGTYSYATILYRKNSYHFTAMVCSIESVKIQ